MGNSIIFGMCGTLVCVLLSSNYGWNILTSVAGKSVKLIDDNRWCARLGEVNAEKKYFSEILSTLEKLTDEDEN